MTDQPPPMRAPFGDVAPDLAREVFEETGAPAVAWPETERRRA